MPFYPCDGSNIFRHIILTSTTLDSYGIFYIILKDPPLGHCSQLEFLLFALALNNVINHYLLEFEK